jgi:sugar lactone lactonase YvrE
LVIDTGWELVASNLAFPEAPHWHDQSLWFSDIFDGQVKRLEPDGDVAVVATVPGRPSGLGWRPDGSLLVVSMANRQLLSFDGTTWQLVADLSPVAGGDCNDMIVDRSGLAYVGNFGYHPLAGRRPRAARLAMVDLAGEVHEVAVDLRFPNGMAITPDGTTLLVAETRGNRVTAFTIEADGMLKDRRIYADLGDATPDGITLDAEGAVWIASPGTREVLLVREGGRVIQSLEAPGGMAQACVLGGQDGRCLYVCCSPTHDADRALSERTGSIWSRLVDVPAAAAPPRH